MKTITKWCLATVLVAGITVSCEQEPSIKPVSRLAGLTDKALSSESFSRLRIPSESLDAANALYINSAENSVYIPFRNAGQNRGLIAYFNEKDNVRGVVGFEASTSLSGDEALAAYRNGTLTVNYTFKSEYGVMEIGLVNSRLANSKFDNKSGRVRECAGATETGGALWCAGMRLENMNWFDRTLCYLNFPVCMAELIASCIIDDCVPTPVVSPN